MTSQTVVIEIRWQYGKKRFFPVCENAKRFSSLAGRKTLYPEDLTTIEELGFVIEVKQNSIKETMP